jgi:competence protein ComEA
MRRRASVVVACLIGAFLAPRAWAGKAVDGVVNLNTAEVSVLGLLPGVGPAKATQIVVYRKRHPFRTVDELVRIKGIGRKMVRRLRPHLAVSGPTTATGIAVPPGAAPPPAPSPPPRPPPLPSRPLCARPSLPQRPKREPQPTHGACPRSP